MTAESCGNCYYMRDNPRFAVTECRRKPPNFLSNGDGQWPSVAEFDWCGEWAAKAKRKSQSTGEKR